VSTPASSPLASIVSDACAHFETVAEYESNRRAAPRADLFADVMLYLDGEMLPARLINLSSTGAQIDTTERLAPGALLSVGMYLNEHTEEQLGLDFINFALEVIDSLPGTSADGLQRYRCRNLTPAGSEAQRRATALVFGAFERGV
jgi:hypothetical protein